MPYNNSPYDDLSGPYGYQPYAGPKSGPHGGLYYPNGDYSSSSQSEYGNFGNGYGYTYYGGYGYNAYNGGIPLYIYDYYGNISVIGYAYYVYGAGYYFNGAGPYQHVGHFIDPGFYSYYSYGNYGNYGYYGYSGNYAYGSYGYGYGYYGYGGYYGYNGYYGSGYYGYGQYGGYQVA